METLIKAFSIFVITLVISLLLYNCDARAGDIIIHNACVGSVTTPGGNIEVTLTACSSTPPVTPTCQPPMVAQGSVCVCPPPNTMVGGVCTPPPPPTGCSSSMGPGDLDWTGSNFVTTQVWPREGWVAANGDAGLAVKIVAQNLVSSRGIEFDIVDQTPQLLAKDAVISACPHDFTPVLNQASCAVSNVSNFASILTKWGALPDQWYECRLVPSATYYINVRASGPSPRGTAYTQFNATPL